MRKNTKRSAIVAAVGAVIIGGGAAAWAFGWGVTGTGTATGKTSDVVPLTSVTDLGGQNVYPGAKATVWTTVTNPNDFPVKLKDDAVKVTKVYTVNGSTKSDNDGCAGPINSAIPQNGLIIPSFIGTPIVPGKNGTKQVSLEVNVGDIPEECANQNIEVLYSFTGQGVSDAEAAPQP